MIVKLFFLLFFLYLAFVFIGIPYLAALVLG